MLDLNDPYWWTEDHPVTTLTFLAGWSQAAMAEALGGLPDGPSRRLDEVDGFSPVSAAGRSLHRVQVAEQGRWTVLVEPNGCAGIHEPLCRCCRADGVRWLCTALSTP